MSCEGLSKNKNGISCSDGLAHIAELDIWIKKNKKIANVIVDKEHEKTSKR